MASPINLRELQAVAESPLGEEFWYVRFLPTLEEKELSLEQVFAVMQEMMSVIREKRKLASGSVDLLTFVDRYFSDMDQHRGVKVVKLKDYQRLLYDQIWSLLFAEIQFLFQIYQ